VYSNISIARIPTSDGKGRIFRKSRKYQEAACEIALPRLLISSPTPRAVLQPESRALAIIVIRIILSVRDIFHDPSLEW
jgi:hypothetical protein